MSETITLDTLLTTPDNASQSATSHVPAARQPHNARQSQDVQPHNATVQRDLDNAVSEYEAAAKLLSLRHAVLGEQPAAAEDLPPCAPSGKQAQLRRARSVSLPPRMSSLEHRFQQEQTANNACEGYQRRKLIKDIAYQAAYGCETATGFVDQVNAHAAIKARHTDTPDLTLSFDGFHIRVSQLGSVEWKWIFRFNAARNNHQLVERRLMSPDDSEIIFTQLFPTDCARLYNVEHFQVFVSGLGEEGILTKQQAKKLSTLAVTAEELDSGAHLTGPSSRYDYRNDPSAVALFEMPTQPSRSIGTFSNGHTKYAEQDLFFYLRLLAESAAYNTSFWRGYFIPNARSLIHDFHAAHTITQDGWSVPPSLTAFKRPWTYRETRLLHRAHLVARLLDMWDAGTLTDFGIVRAVRGTYVHVPMHSFCTADELASFLYARVADSGLPVAKIPEILGLHPEHDGAFRDEVARKEVVAALEGRAQEFEMEEVVRLSLIEESLTSFQREMRKRMGRWERVKMRLRKVLGCEVKVAPFDPYAPEHDVERAG
jgi:hypothetical protein